MYKIPTKIQKRDKSIVDFDSKKITIAIKKAFIATNTEYDKEEIITQDVIKNLFPDKNDMVNIEQVQDSVEKALVNFKYYVQAKEYILYRQKRSDIRKDNG